MSDFAWTPTFPLEERVIDKTIKSQFESGHTQTRRKWSAVLRAWTLRFNNVVAATEVAVKAFYATKGAHTSFTWTNPNDSVEYTVRFVEDSLVSVMVGYQLYDIELQLEEVR